ncbi:MAG: four helix bundle protein [Acidobacteriota bacterium]|nr:four helix bundle protein [Acidobacteriota bacterium]
MSKKVEKFEDLIAWQKARKLTARIYKTTNQGNFARDYSRKDQIRRAAVSTMSNIAEGFERGGAAEFHRFLVMAKGSCAELRNQLYIALDVAYIPADAFDSLMGEAIEVGKIIGGLRASIQRQRAGLESTN